MTSEERADFLRREAIRAARFEAWVQRQLAAQREAQWRAQQACESALRKSPQSVLDFAI